LGVDDDGDRGVAGAEVDQDGMAVGRRGGEECGGEGISGGPDVEYDAVVICPGAEQFLQVILADEGGTERVGEAAEGPEADGIEGPLGFGEATDAAGLAFDEGAGVGGVGGRGVEDVAQDLLGRGDEDERFRGEGAESFPDILAEFLGGRGAVLEGVDDQGSLQARSAPCDGGDEDAGALAAGVDDGEVARRQTQQVGEGAGWERGSHGGYCSSCGEM
jgi:hypothetical protein